jgi:hypothetical protein
MCSICVIYMRELYEKLYERGLHAYCLLALRYVLTYNKYEGQTYNKYEELI